MLLKRRLLTLCGLAVGRVTRRLSTAEAHPVLIAHRPTLAEQGAPSSVMCLLVSKGALAKRRCPGTAPTNPCLSLMS